MKISVANSLITIFIVELLAAVASNSTDSRSPMEATRDAVLSLAENEYTKYCSICSSLLLNAVEKKCLEDGNDTFPFLASCPYSPEQ